MWIRRAAALAVLCALFVASNALAHDLSDYEKQSIDIALEATESEVDPRPEGKWIEDIDVVPLDVIEKRDPAPGFLNWVHVTSRTPVIEREVLLRPGERFDRARLEESERNLRAHRQLSVVLIVPTKGSEPDRVRLLVVTKDVWSLRVNWEPTFYNDPEDGQLKVRSLVLQPSEENFVGRHKILNGTVALAPLNYSVGLGFRDPRIAGSRLATSMAANVIVNCNTNRAEGSTGGFLYGKPLYSMRTKWAWGAGMTWSDGYVRPQGAVGQSLCNGQRPRSVVFAPSAADPNASSVSIPYEFHQNVLRGEVSVTRSFGIRFKNDVTFGLEADRRVYRGPPELATAGLAVQQQFAGLMPVSDTRIGPFVQLHAFENRFLRTIDLETLGLQEDYLLGHDVWLRAYPAAQAAGSTRDLIGIGSGLAYTLPLASGFVRAYVTSGIELSHAGQSDAQVAAGSRIVSPRLPFGRFIADGYILDRYRNYLNPLVSLGGTDRLRGYRPQAFVGPNVAVVNFEFRSRPIQILTVQTGIAVFYDVGDTGSDMAHIQLRHGVGGGLRLAFPQIQRSVFRIDFGVPLNPNDPAAGANVVAKFEQAFDVPIISSPSLLQ
jgi:hypothetical protein